jgi:hypothetical protein
MSEEDDDFDFEAELRAIFQTTTASEEASHEWQARLVWREGNDWHATEPTEFHRPIMTYMGERQTELFFQRRRKRDLYDPTPCEGIEHPVWRDWEASPDPDIQGVLMAKGMPFRSLEK